MCSFPFRWKFPMRSHWIGVDCGQNVAVVAATPDGPVVFWKARQIRHVRRVFARRRQMLPATGKHRAVKKLENEVQWPFQSTSRSLL
jgi:hypothetical protein